MNFEPSSSKNYIVLRASVRHSFTVNVHHRHYDGNRCYLRRFRCMMLVRRRRRRHRRDTNATTTVRKCAKIGSAAATSSIEARLASAQKTSNCTRSNLCNCGYTSLPSDEHQHDDDGRSAVTSAATDRGNGRRGRRTPATGLLLRAAAATRPCRPDENVEWRWRRRRWPKLLRRWQFNGE